MDWSKIAPWNWFQEERPAADPPRWTPRRGEPAWDPFANLRTDMERFFDEALRRPFSGLPATPASAAPVPLRPQLDISEGKKAYTVRAELPGVERDDVTLEVDGQTLVIRAEKRQESAEEDEGYHCIERSYGIAQRVLSLPEDADGESIEATFRNGVLKLRIPKRAQPEKRGKSIEIRSP